MSVGEERALLPQNSLPDRDARADVEDTRRECSDDVEPDFKTILISVGPMALGTFLAAADQSLVLASSALVGDELKDLPRASWVSTAYMLSLASFQPLYGKLSDIFGRKRCLLAAYVIFALGCLACGAARNMSQLIAARVFAGIGGGGMSVTVSVIMSDIIPLRARGTWQGYINIVWATGSAFGAPFGGLLADTIGWRWSFMLQAPLTMVAFSAVALVLRVPSPPPAPWREKASRIDFLGSLSLVAGLGSLLTTLDHAGNIGWSDYHTVLALSIFAVFAAIFFFVEAKIAREPIAPLRLLTRPSLLGPYVCNLASLGCSICTVFYVSLYIQAVRERTAAQAGAMLLPSIIASVTGSLLGGKAIERWGKLIRLTMGMYIVMICGSVTILLSTGVVGHSYVGLGFGLAMMSLGNGCGLTTSLVSLIGQAGKEQAVVTAMSYLFRSVGSLLCLSIGSTIFQATLRRLLYRNLHDLDVDEVVRRIREALSYMDHLDPHTRMIVHEAYEHALQTTFAFCVHLSAISFLSTFWFREKPILA